MQAIQHLPSQDSFVIVRHAIHLRVSPGYIIYILTYMRSRTPSLLVLYRVVHVVVLLCSVVLALQLQQLEVVTVPFFVRCRGFSSKVR